MVVTTPLPYYCQWDNQLWPGGSCNLTAAAMVLKKWNKPGPKMGYARLPDNLLAYADANGLDRHDLRAIDKIIETFGLKDASSYTTKWADLKAHIKQGYPAIVHGYFTPSGHIIAIHGVDEDKGRWLCNDPAGKWDNGYRDNVSGEDVWYDSAWLKQMINPDAELWAHLVQP